MTHVNTDRDAIVIEGSNTSLTYTPRAVTLSNGTTIAHDSQGGELSSVWATDLGDCYVEVVYVGDGPVGGELVVVVPVDDVVIVGDLYPGPDDPAEVPLSWPPAVDLAMSLTSVTTRVLSSLGWIERDEFDASHQRLLGVVNG